jgi:sortase A
VLLGVERVCWAAGSLLLLFWLAVRIDGAVAQETAFERFDQASASPEPIPNETIPNEPIKFARWAPKRVAAYLASLAHPLETPLATLEIPRLGLRVAVFDGTDDVRLDRGVGRIPGTARPGEAGNLAIAGHRDGFFRALKDILPGDEVRLTTLAGSEVYSVDRYWIVTPDEVEVLDSTASPSLTLITCYPFYYVGSAPQRFVVRASRLDPPNATASGTLVVPGAHTP